MKTKLIGLLTVFLIGVLAVCGIASADLNIREVKIDGTNVLDRNRDPIRLDLVKGNDVEVKVVAEAVDASLDDVQIEAFIRGYDHDDLIEDITDVFDMINNTMYTKKLTLTVPQRIEIDPDDEYTMVIMVESRDGVLDILTWNVDLRVSGERHLLEIKDVIFSPENTVQAGRALLASVRVKNYGQKDEEGIKVKVSIPDLGISASDYIDEIEADEATTSEELYLRIPSCSEEGTYDVKVEVSYDDGDEKLIQMESIRIVADETCEVPEEDSCRAAADDGERDTGAKKATIVYDATAQEVTAGKAGAIYALTMSNPTGSAKTVTINVNGVDVFGEARVSPSNVAVLGAGETKTVYIYVTADEKAKAGQYSFTATVAGLGSSTEEIPLTADVAEPANLGSLKRALEIGLVVLVVILVILGLIVGFNKLKGDEEEADEESQTYY